MPPTIEKNTTESSLKTGYPLSNSEATQPITTYLPPTDPPIASAPQKPFSPPKRSKKKWFFVLLSAFLIIAGGAAAYFLLNQEETKTTSRNTNQTAGQIAPNFFYIDYNNKSLALTDGSGKELYKIPYTEAEFTTYQATAPNGGILVSFYTYTEAKGYSFISVNGKEQSLSSNAVTVLKDSLGTTTGGRPVFIDDNNMVLTTCKYQEGKLQNAKNNCKLVKLNIFDGTATTIVETLTPVSTATGESIFDLLRVSDDRKQAYLRTAGPNKLGESKDTIYKVDLISNQSVQFSVLPDDNEARSTLSLSPDLKKLIYKSGGSPEATVLRVIDIASGKETKVSWKTDYITDNWDSLIWSPDSSKVLFQGNAHQEGVSSVGPITTAYLDLGKNEIVNLQTIQDSAHNNIGYQAWLESDTIVYELSKSTLDHDFRGSTPEAYKQNVSSKKITKVSHSPGTLVQVIFP